MYGVFCLYVCLCITCSQYLQRSEQWVSNSLGLGLQIIVSGCVGAENETQVLRKSGQCS